MIFPAWTENLLIMRGKTVMHKPGHETCGDWKKSKQTKAHSCGTQEIGAIFSNFHRPNFTFRLSEYSLSKTRVFCVGQKMMAQVFIPNWASEKAARSICCLFHLSKYEIIFFTNPPWIKGVTVSYLSLNGKPYETKGATRELEAFIDILSCPFHNFTSTYVHVEIFRQSESIAQHKTEKCACHLWVQEPMNGCYLY